MQNSYFRDTILRWNRAENTRQMPWKGEKDPYRIWLSEVILQQTRVEQGWGYYEKFVDSFPQIEDLAGAPEEGVFKLWEGLGYYSRCKNLIHTAKYIAEEYKGRFPDNYAAILALKGIGPYTAAAIASFAFGLPHAVVDGNVLRVLSRFFGVRTPIDTSAGKTELTELAEKCLDKDNPAEYNQTLMDFGAVVCKPANPQCSTCPLSSRCTAYREKIVDTLPQKSKRLVRKDRYFLYILAQYQDGAYARKRTGKDIWQNLHEFISYEFSQGHGDVADWENIAPILKGPWFRTMMGETKYTVEGLSPAYRQLLTHQSIQARFLKISLDAPLSDPGDYQFFSPDQLTGLAFPRILNEYLHTKVQTGQLF
jgi:A/G-specific adenine glycosylase